MSKRPSKSVSDNVRKSGEALEVETGATGLGVEKTAGGEGGLESRTEAGFSERSAIRSAFPFHVSSIEASGWAPGNPSDSEAAFSVGVGVEDSVGAESATLPEKSSAGSESGEGSNSWRIPEFPESASTSVSMSASAEASDSGEAHWDIGNPVRKTGTPFEEEAYENSSTTILKGSKSRRISSSLFSVILL